MNETHRKSKRKRINDFLKFGNFHADVRGWIHFDEGFSRHSLQPRTFGDVNHGYKCWA